MSIWSVRTPILDGAAVQLGDGTVKQRHITIPEGSYATPFWVRFDNGAVVKVTSLPARLTRRCGGMEVLSTDPEGAQLTPLFFSDYRTVADGSASTSRSDNGKWGDILGMANGQIVTAPADFPCHKILLVQSPDNDRDSATAIYAGGILGLPSAIPIGGIRNFRFYMQYLLPDGETPNFHGIGDSQAIGSKNWDINAVYDNAGNWGFNLNFAGFGTRFGSWPFDWGGAIVNGQGGMSKTGCYRFEMQLVRTGTSTGRFHCRVYHRVGSTETLAYDDDTLVCDDDGQTWDNLAQYNTQGGFTLPHPETTQQFMMGHNGVTPPPTNLPFTHSYQGAVAIVDGLAENQFIGEYGSVVGEVPR